MAVQTDVASFEGRNLSVIHYDGEPHLTAEHIGAALDYEQPRKSVMNIYNRNKEELDDYSFVINLMTKAGAGGTGPTRIFNEEGVMVITMLSRQPKAREFRRWAVRVLKAHRRVLTVPFGGNEEPPFAKLDAGLMRELRRVNTQVVSAYLVANGITPRYVAGLLSEAGYPTRNLDDVRDVPTLDFIRERIQKYVTAEDNVYWYFKRDAFERLCGQYDLQKTAQWFRDIGILRTENGRLTFKGPRRLFSVGTRPNVFALIKTSFEEGRVI